MDDVLTELRLLDEHYDRMFTTVLTYIDENTRQHKELWNDLAELRDGLLALSNRLESCGRVIDDVAILSAKHEAAITSTPFGVSDADA